MVGEKCFNCCAVAVPDVLIEPEATETSEAEISSSETTSVKQHTTSTTIAVHSSTTVTETVQSKVNGDANLDGKVTVAYAVAILQHIGCRDKYPLKKQGLINADVDVTEGVTANDAYEIKLWDSER